MSDLRQNPKHQARHPQKYRHYNVLHLSVCSSSRITERPPNTRSWVRVRATVLQNRARYTKNSLYSNAVPITLSAFGMQAIGGFTCKPAAYPVSVWPVDVIFEIYGGTAHKYCIFTSRGVRLALVKSNELGISGANGVW